jgi:hypothetical protein
MDMADMGMGMGMDTGAAGMFRPVNMYLAKTYWYLIIAAAGFGLIVNAITRGNERLRFVVLFSPFLD